MTIHLFLGGIPGDHLIVPVSGHGVPSPMHLRLGQKNVWTEEYVDKEEEGGMDGVEAIEAEEEEKHCLDGDEKGQFEGRVWEDEEEEGEDEDVEEEEEGDKDELEWEIAEFPSKVPQHTYSQHQYYKLQQKADDDDDDIPVKDPVPQTQADIFRPPLGRNRGPRRLRHWQHVRTHKGIGFRLTQHWKGWRLRAQWLCSQGHRYHRRWQRHSMYAKRRAIKRYQQLPGTDGKDDCLDEDITGFHGGTHTILIENLS